jgi:hypothetical protein
LLKSKELGSSVTLIVISHFFFRAFFGMPIVSTTFRLHPVRSPASKNDETGAGTTWLMH